MPALAAEDSDPVGLRFVSVKAEHSSSDSFWGEMRGLPWPGLLFQASPAGSVRLAETNQLITDNTACSFSANKQQYISKHRTRERKKAYRIARCVASEGTLGMLQAKLINKAFSI